MTTPVAGPYRALVVGASGGIGAAMASALAAAGTPVHAVARRLPQARPGILPGRVDVTDEASIAAALSAIAPDPPLRLVIVATGLLHDGALQPEKTLRTLDAARLARSFAVNTIGPALVAKHALPLLPRDGRSVFAVLSARVGSIGDNRVGGWYGYRASKAALNQVVRTLAVEMGEPGPRPSSSPSIPGRWRRRSARRSAAMSRRSGCSRRRLPARISSASSPG